MTKTIFFVLGLLLLFPEESFGELPVVSANGFSCSKRNDLVSCVGKIPEHPTPEYRFAGKDMAILSVEFENYRISYASHTGCMCIVSYGGKKNPSKIICRSGMGSSKIFKSEEGENVLNWCEKN